MARRITKKDVERLTARLVRGSEWLASHELNPKNQDVFFMLSMMASIIDQLKRHVEK